MPLMHGMARNGGRTTTTTKTEGATEGPISREIDGSKISEQNLTSCSEEERSTVDILFPHDSKIKTEDAKTGEGNLRLLGYGPI